MLNNLEELQTAIDDESTILDEVRFTLQHIRDDSADDVEARRAALLLHLIDGDYPEATPDDVSHDRENTFAYLSHEYLVLTDAEATELAKEQAVNGAWSFNASFIAGLTGVDSAAIRPLCNLCESGQEAILAIIKGTCGVDKFVAKAIDDLSREHFLAGYDGEVQEQGKFLIYRTN